MSGPPRGGRGEALRRLLDLEKKKQESTPGTQQEQNVEGSQAAGTSQSSAGAVRCSGRGSFLMKLQQNIEEAKAVSVPIKETDSEEELLAKLTIESREEKDKPAEKVVNVGTSGSKVDVACNYIRLNFERGKGVFQYHVSFSPEIDAMQLRRFFIYKEVTEVIGSVKTFDGSVLYLPHKLPDEVTVLTKEMPTEKSEVTITIQFVKKLDMGHRECIHLYNVLFKRIMNELGLILHGDNYYNPKSPVEVPAYKLQIWPGYVTAIEDYEGGVMLCCDVSHRILHTQTAHDWMYEVQNRVRQNEDWKPAFVRSMVGQNVLTRYNNKVYRVDDIDFGTTPSCTFKRRDTEISYKDYFKTQYNLSIKDLKQPLLVSRVKCRIDGKMVAQNVNLIPEFCFLSGLTSELKENFHAMKEIAITTRVSPAHRVKCLQEFLNNISSNPNAHKILSDWGLSIENKCIKLTARVLPLDQVIIGNNKKAKVGVDWTNDLTRNPILSAESFFDWVVICTGRDDPIVKDFLNSCQMVSKQMGLDYGRPSIKVIQKDHPQFILQVLNKEKNNVNFFMLILPSARTDLYNLFKQFCNVDNAIPSQVILTKTIRNPAKNRAVAQKVLLQINCKLGGTLWTVNNHVKSTMVVGLDTYHDPTRKQPSVGALVCSFDKELTHWVSRCYKQTPGTELGNSLSICFLECLQHYQFVNGCYPSQVIVYRDGIGAGQLEACKQFELSQFFTAFKLAEINDIKLLFVVVQKRINTRIFTYAGSTFENPAPGTVVDHTVTNKYLYDFFLASQSVRQGTATPTHYVVLYNTTKLDPDKVQRFTFMMTFLYYNWFGTIRVPAPCLYAHKLAGHVGENLMKPPNLRLADKLFFL